MEAEKQLSDTTVTGMSPLMKRYYMIFYKRGINFSKTLNPKEKINTSR